MPCLNTKVAQGHDFGYMRDPQKNRTSRYMKGPTKKSTLGAKGPVPTKISRWDPTSDVRRVTCDASAVAGGAAPRDLRLWAVALHGAPGGAAGLEASCELRAASCGRRVECLPSVGLSGGGWVGGGGCHWFPLGLPRFPQPSYGSAKGLLKPS